MSVEVLGSDPGWKVSSLDKKVWLFFISYLMRFMEGVVSDNAL